jgi:hypothetical protein
VFFAYAYDTAEMLFSRVVTAQYIIVPFSVFDIVTKGKQITDAVNADLTHVYRIVINDKIKADYKLIDKISIQGGQ